MAKWLNIFWTKFKKTAIVPFLTHFQLSSSWPHYLSILAKMEGKDGLTATFYCLSHATFHF
jgi:hypothetical protein